MVCWLIGLSGSGKTTLGEEVKRIVVQQIDNLVYIDGDVIRTIFGNDLGHSKEDRLKNAWRICHLCNFLDSQGINVLCSVLSLFPETQSWNRQNYKKYFEVFIDVPMDILIHRDSKGLYQGALEGKITNVVGIDIYFPPPPKPDLIISNQFTLDHLLSFSNEIASKFYKNNP